MQSELQGKIQFLSLFSQVAHSVVSQDKHVPTSVKYYYKIHDIQNPSTEQVSQSLLQSKIQFVSESLQVAQTELSQSKHDPVFKNLPSTHESHD